MPNEKYMGHCLAQKSVTVDFLTHKRVRNKDHQLGGLCENHRKSHCVQRPRSRIHF